MSGAPSAEFLRLIPHEFARRHLILSTGMDEGVAAQHINEMNVGDHVDDVGAHAVERLLVSSSTRPAPIHNVGVRLGRSFTTHITDAESLAAAIDRAYAAHHADHRRTQDGSPYSRHDDQPQVSIDGDLAAPVEDELREVLAKSDADLLRTQGKAPLVKLVDLLLFEAVQRQASDIHVQPLSDRTLIRDRLDGVLHTVREFPPRVLPAIVSRVKVMARLDVAERGAPQDGRTTVTLGNASGDGATTRQSDPRRIDLRISTLPTTYGERVVIRLLDTARSPHLLRFSALGMPPEVERPLVSQIARTSGIILSTGPTGSGKTTTLYTVLAWVSGGGSHARSATLNAQPKADCQVRQANREQRAVMPVGPLTASSCPLLSSSPAPPLASSLLPSSDLNIMTIEDPVEYDLSTAGLSISQTQLNTKKGVTFAAGLRHILRQDPDVIMVGEIRDEETARVAVQASLTGHLVLSTLHTNDAAGAVARLLDLAVEPFLVGSTLAAVLAQRLARRIHVECAGRGCPGCLHTGYKGRTGVFELLALDAELRERVSQRVSAAEVKALALSKGMVDLQEAGRRLVAAGVTTREELARVIEGVE